jgi:uncharacterized protein YjiK
MDNVISKNWILKATFMFLALVISSYSGFTQESVPGAIFLEENYHFPYNLQSPNKDRQLSKQLVEISGIACLDTARLACVQDEKGRIYIISFPEAKIEEQIVFADHGDFEGIAVVDKTAWILKSSGDLYKVDDYLEKDKVRTTKFETELSKKNDTEGLTFDAAHKRLLIACKGYPFIDTDHGKHKRAIYEFDLEKEALNPTPIFILDLDEIKDFRGYNTMTKWGIKLLSKIDQNKGDVSFQPSDLAIHPFTKNIYVIGSVGDLLVILNPEGNVLAMIDLDDKLFRQPEGISFDENGMMYISNEGKETRATILAFKMSTGQ